MMAGQQKQLNRNRHLKLAGDQFYGPHSTNAFLDMFLPLTRHANHENQPTRGSPLKFNY